MPLVGIEASGPLAVESLGKAEPVGSPLDGRIRFAQLESTMNRRSFFAGLVAIADSLGLCKGSQATTAQKVTEPLPKPTVTLCGCGTLGNAQWTVYITGDTGDK